MMPCWTKTQTVAKNASSEQEVTAKMYDTRRDILRKAEECVCGHREQDYGTPEDSFQCIARLWSAYYGKQFTPVDVAMMMALLKVARIRTGSATADSFVDLAGYAACGGEIASRAGKSNPAI